MVAKILSSRIYKLEEFNALGRQNDLYNFLNNRVYIINDDLNPDNLWNSIIEWIEQNLEGKVIIKETSPPTGGSSYLSYFIYFERDTDLSMFAMRWQGKDE